MGTLVRADILNLTLAERIQLVEDIWDSIVEYPEAVSLSEAQKAELDKRLEEYQQAPGAGSPWAIVRDRIRSGK